MAENNVNFYFPSKILKSEDFSPFETLILKDYYRNAFLKLIDKVRKKKIINLYKDRKASY